MWVAVTQNGDAGKPLRGNRQNESENKMDFGLWGWSERFYKDKSI